MAFRRPIARLIGAVFFAYVLVMQAAAGGFVAAGHDMSADPLGVICLNSSAASVDATSDETAKAGLGCCAFGCVSAVIAPASTPEAAPFAYAPRPTPRRAVGERDAGPSDDLPTQVGRPRGPPSIG